MSVTSYSQTVSRAMTTEPTIQWLDRNNSRFSSSNERKQSPDGSWQPPRKCFFLLFFLDSEIHILKATYDSPLLCRTPIQGTNL